MKDRQTFYQTGRSIFEFNDVIMWFVIPWTYNSWHTASILYNFATLLSYPIRNRIVSRLRLCRMRVLNYYVKIKQYLRHQRPHNKNKNIAVHFYMAYSWQIGPCWQDTLDMSRAWTPISLIWGSTLVNDWITLSRLISTKWIITCIPMWN